jgi:hypothetical protein
LFVLIPVRELFYNGFMAKEKLTKEQQELIELGKKLKNFYEMGYVSRRQALSFSFFKGVLGGAGAFIGGTLVIALVIWTLSIFSEAPIIGEIAKQIQDSLQK